MENLAKKDVTEEKYPRQIEEILESFQGLEADGASMGEAFEKIKALYASLAEQDRALFFRAILKHFEIPKEELEALLRKLLNCEEKDPQWHSLLAELRSRVYSPRLKIFQEMSRAPGGLKFLLDFRGDLLAVRRRGSAELGPLDADITFLFEMWFQEGFLFLEEITLQSSYNQIALIKDRDLVHPMASIEEMGQRLGRDRRCFALYHRLIPYEPVIFIEVALTEGVVRNISEIMAVTDAKERKAEADTAIFYSINNTQNGLAGLGLGKILIGKVVHYLKRENEKIRNFATLSPVPGFWKRYLNPLLEGRDENFKLKKEEIIGLFPKRSIGRVLEYAGVTRKDSEGFCTALNSILSDESWAGDEEIAKELRNPLVRIAYEYVANEKNPQNKPLDPVANFHLENGATVSLKNVNFMANPSSKGLGESCGIMVNYIYSSNWLSQIRHSLRWFDRMEIRGLFARRR